MELPQNIPKSPEKIFLFGKSNKISPPLIQGWGMGELLDLGGGAADVFAAILLPCLAYTSAREQGKSSDALIGPWGARDGSLHD